jgi:hypothetical protein
MKKLVLLALAASTVAVVTPAAAQVTGTVEVTGTVVGRCSVVQPGGGAGVATFTGAIPLGNLDEADGTLLTSLEGTTSAAPAGNVVEARIVCNSANTNIHVEAGKLSNLAPADPGYSNDIDYTAELEVATASTGLQTAKYNTLAPVAADHTKTIGRIAAGAANNVKVRAYALAAEGGLTSLLVAGGYASTITVTINPAP